jgi:four helix bundle protein
MEFTHESLDVYRLAVAVARWVAAQPFPTARRHLRDQAVRAADSVVLNVAEGLGHPVGDARRNHLRIALGSAAEVSAVLDLIDLPGGAEKHAELRRVGAMLAKLSRR